MNECKEDFRVVLSKHKLALLVEYGVISEIEESGQHYITIEVKK